MGTVAIGDVYNEAIVTSFNSGPMINIAEFVSTKNSLLQICSRFSMKMVTNVYFEVLNKLFM